MPNVRILRSEKIILNYLDSAINKLPLAFATLMDNIAKQSGWNIIIMAGGPHPSDEGKMSSLMYMNFTFQINVLS
jgi:hypothetical protein